MRGEELQTYLIKVMTGQRYLVYKLGQISVIQLVLIRIKSVRKKFVFPLVI